MRAAEPGHDEFNRLLQHPAMSKPKRPWSVKFRDALRGVRLGMRGHSSFYIHIPCAILALTLAAILKCDRVEWCLIIGCVGFVLAAELANSAIETLFHALDDQAKGRMIGCLDTAAGAVLVAAVTAVVVGAIVFMPKVVAFLN
jgi:diacylglycerol kinase